MSESYERLSKVRESLRKNLIDKENEIDAVIAAVISGENCILLGPPGTGKTLLIESLANMLGAKYFYYLLSRFTEPDELLGPVDIPSLMRGEFKRNTSGKLPEADVVFLDEVFRGSSSIRNMLLDIILSKRLNGEPLKLISVFGASNEPPSEEEDMAFYDRFAIRVFTDYVQESKWRELFEAEIEGESSEEERDNRSPLLGRRDLDVLRGEVRKRLQKVSSEIISRYISILLEMKVRGLEISDRRKGKVIKMASALAVEERQGEVSIDHLVKALRLTVPSNKDDMLKLEESISSAGVFSSSEILERIRTLITEARTLEEKINENSTAKELRAVSDFISSALTFKSSLPDNSPLRTYIGELSDAIEKLQSKYRKVMGG